MEVFTLAKSGQKRIDMMVSHLDSVVYYVLSMVQPQVM